MTEVTQLTLPAEPASAAAARAFLHEHATLDGMRHAEADLLVTELIGNVLEHSPKSSEIVVGAQQDRDRGLVVSVSHPHPQPLEDSNRGVGFMLLERKTRAWGHDHDGEMLTVWFVLRTPGTTSIPAEIPDSDLFSRMAEDPASYSDELVRRHTDLAASIARRYRGKGVDEDDLLQVANMALLKAIQRYDPSIGSIRPYAAATISGELKRLLRDKGWSVRVPRSLQERSLEVAKTAELLAQKLNRPPETHEIAEQLELTEEEVVEALDARQAYASSSIDKPADNTGVTLLERLEDDDVQLLLADDRVVVGEAVSQLPERQQRILDLRFNEDLTQTEIAEELGISQMHVSRLLASALESLKKSIGKEGESD
ncbi:MAG TPA: sigma-70 family RNA polymerase sigma factor [Acidimicrobiia bacterium]